MPPRVNPNYAPPPLQHGPTGFPQHLQGAAGTLGGMATHQSHLQYTDRERYQLQQAQLQALQVQQQQQAQVNQHQQQLHHQQAQQMKHALQQQQQHQQQHQHQAQMPAMNNIAALTPSTSISQVATRAASSPIRNVWASNLESEMAILRDLVDKYNYIAMDTEFPGIIARPMGEFKRKSDYHYQTLRCNVDILKMIQLGITLFDEEGITPPGEFSTWQFNFKFSLDDDMYAQDSIELLKSSGIEFGKAAKDGIDIDEFGSLLITSGLVLLDNVKWISFHSGYDLGYLVKTMICKPLPFEESDFAAYIRTFFPVLYDIKYLAKSGRLPITRSSLQDIAEEMQVKRVGPQHQAGSDSLLTGRLFFEIRKSLNNGSPVGTIDEELTGKIWGLNGVGSSNYNGVNTHGAVIYNQGRPETPATTNGVSGNEYINGNGLAGTPGVATPGPRDPAQNVFQYGKMGGGM